MKRLQRYVEMLDTENEDSWTNKVDIYGYENEVIVWAHGYVNTYPTHNLSETKEQMRYVIDRLMDLQFIVINQEVHHEAN